MRRHFPDIEADEEEQEETPPIDVTPPEEITDVVPVFVYDDVRPENNIDPMDIYDFGLPEEQPSAEEEPEEPAPVAVKTRKKAAPKPAPAAEQMSFYNFPPLSLLQQGKQTAGASREELREKEAILLQTLRDFFGPDASWQDTKNQ